MEISTLATIFGVLVALTNVIVEVTKKATWDKIPTNLLALIIGEALSIISGVAYLQMNNIAIAWYYIVALIVIGFVVAYTAMFGFDKLKEIFNWKKEEV